MKWDEVELANGSVAAVGWLGVGVGARSQVSALYLLPCLLYVEGIVAGQTPAGRSSGRGQARRQAQNGRQRAAAVPFIRVVRALKSALPYLCPLATAIENVAFPAISGALRRP